MAKKKRMSNNDAGPIQPSEAQIRRRAQVILEISGRGGEAFQKSSDAWGRALKQARGELELANVGINKLANNVQIWAERAKTLNSIITAPIAGLNKLGNAFGAAGVGFKASLDTVNQFQNQLRVMSSQFTKYGVGITEVEKNVESLAERYKFLRKDMMDLMSSFESGFDIAPVNDMVEIFDKLKDSVGANKEAMLGLMGSLSGFVNKSPTLGLAFGATKDKDAFLKKAGFAMAASGQLSIGEAKKLDEYLKGGSAITKADTERKKAIDEQTRAFRSINKFFEDINMKMGSQLMPQLTRIVKALDQWLPTLSTIAAGVGIVTGILGPILSAVIGAPGVVQTLAPLLRGVMGVGGGSGMGSAIGGGLAAGGRLLGAAAPYVGTAAIAGLGGYGIGKGASWAGKKMFGEDVYEKHGTAMKVGTTGIGAAGGAGLGALIGTFVFPGIGTLAGAGIGAAAGAIGGYFAGKGDEEDSIREHKEKRWRGRANELELTAMGAGGASEADKQVAAFERSELLPLRKELEEAKESGDQDQIDFLNQKIALLDQQKSEMIEHNRLAQENFEKMKQILGPITRYTIQVKAIEEIYKNQNDLLNAQEGVLDSMLELFGASMDDGALAQINAEMDAYLGKLKDVIGVNAELQKTIDEGMKSAEMKGFSKNQVSDKAAEVRAAETALNGMKAGTSEYEKQKTVLDELNAEFYSMTGFQASVYSQQKKAKSDEYKLENDIGKIAEKVTKERARQAEYAGKQTSYLESQMNLANSLGTGMRASVNMQMQVVKAAENEKNLARETIAALDQKQQQVDEDLQKQIAGATTLEEKEHLRRVQSSADLKFNNERIDQQKKLVDLTTKQAEITKSLREGYISAIQAMTTGAGVFTRIVISQNQRLGNLVFGAPSRIRALRAGSELEGRRGAGMIGFGGLTEGTASDAEKETLSRYGMTPGTVGDIRKSAGAISSFQDSVGNNMSGAMNVFTNNITGSAQVFDAHSKAVGNATTGVTEFGKALERSSVTDFSKTFNSPDFIKNLSDSIADAFKRVAEEASAKAIKELQKGQ